MRHQRSRTRLTQKPGHARMLKRNLVTSLLLYEQVRTTRSRARAVRPMIDRLIACAKKRPAHIAIRSINRVITDKNASRKIMEVYKERFKNRPSGFTRAVPAGVRKGDGAELVDVMLVDTMAGVASEEPEKKSTKSRSLTSSRKGSSKSSISSNSSKSSL